MSNVSQSLQGRPNGMSAWIARHSDAIMAIAIGFALAAKLLLVFRINIHWDEFYFLSQVHDYVRGGLSGSLQTFHVHLFSWLTQLDGEVTQIIAARLATAALATASALAIYGIARRFAPRGAALFAVLGYLALSVVVEHGANFRTDPLATFLTLAALYSVVRRPGNIAAAALAGVALAVAALITVKVAFFLPMIALLIWCQVPDFKAQLRAAAAGGGSFVLVGAALYLLHHSTLAPADRAAVVQLQGVASKVLFEDGVFLRWAELLMVVAFNPLFSIMLAEAAIIAWRSAWTGKRRADWAPLVLALPLLTPLIYRNAFDYYFPLILAPAAILLAIFYDQHQRARAAGASRRVAPIGLLVLAQCGLLAVHVARNLPDEIAPQRSVLAAVHATFPEPVPYIGGYGVAASFPRQGFFMSSWGVEDYRAAGVPVFPDIVARTQPPMLLADSPALYGAMVPGAVLKPEHALFPDDVSFLTDNYVLHWDMLFVAGKRLTIPAGGQPAAFDIAIAGEYRVESTVPVSLDGRALQPGGVATLAIGPHAIEVASGPAEVTLRWARALPPPDQAPVGLLTFFIRQK